MSGTSGNRGPRANGNFVLGAEIDSTPRVNNELVGDMDEFRISDGVRSADWAAASYAIQNNPSTYLTLNCEENSTTENCDDPDLMYDRYYNNMTIKEIAQQRGVCGETIRIKIKNFI